MQAELTEILEEGLDSRLGMMPSSQIKISKVFPLTTADEVGTAWLLAPELHHSHLFPSEEVKNAFTLMGDLHKLKVFLICGFFLLSFWF